MSEDIPQQVESKPPLTEEEKRKRERQLFQGGNPYGEYFNGEYMRVGELQELLPKFKAYYYERKRETPKYSAMKIMAEFNEMIHPERFFPYKNQYSSWRKKWDAELMAEEHKARDVTRAEIKQIVPVRSETGELVPSYESLETGARTLGGELVNDALSILRRDQDEEDGMIDGELLVKRRKYVLDVYKHIQDSVSKKEALKLKKDQGKRESAGFMMELLRASTAGKITEEQMGLLKDTIMTTPLKPEQT